MGTIFYNNIPLSTINPYTLLFQDRSLNIQFNSIQQFKNLPIILFTFIFLYSLATFIYIILTTHNYSESILITSTFIISILSLIVSLCIKFKKNCISIKSERNVELILLTVIFVVFTLINQIFCSHLKHFDIENNSLIETAFINIEIIAKCLWTILNVNEFAYICFGTVVNCIIIIPYNYRRLLTLFSLIIVFGTQSLYSYFFTKLRKEIFIQEKMNVDMKTNDILGFGYATVHMNDGDKVNKLNENEILNGSIVNENSYLKNLFFNANEDKENLFSLLNELEDINDEIKKCLLYFLNYQSEQIQRIEKEKLNQNNRSKFKLSISNSGNSLIQTTTENNNNTSITKAHHKIENSLTNLVSKVSNNFNLILNSKYDNDTKEKSRTFEGQQISKFGWSAFNSQTPSSEIHQQYTFQLAESHMRKNRYFLPYTNNDAGIPIQVQETKENQINENNIKKLNDNINDSCFLLSLLYATGLNCFLKQDEFIYLGRKRINIKFLKAQLADNTMSNIKTSNKHLPIIKNSFDLSLSSPTDFSFYKIYFRYNAILSGLEFVFLDESKDQFENLFKAYSRQVSMYLHDFKNPLTAINEKILDYKEVFQSILVESEGEQMGLFKFGKSELDDLIFLSITSEDCLGMIKSYEDFSKAFANNNNNESMTLNLSSFHISEITNYLGEWINMKNQRTHQDIDFIVNDITLSKHFKLYTDKLKLKQILINLISNSYKFTKNGDITLTITREIINDKQYTKFHIRDSGEGMDETTLKHLFNPYFSKNGDNRNKEGCGLGLVLSMRMSKNLGLPIQVESEENKGTSMWFYIEERENIEENENYMKNNNEEDEDEDINNMDENNNTNNNNLTTLINSAVKEDEDDVSFHKKKEALFNNNLNKSESNLDFIPLTFNESRVQNTTIVEDSSFCKSRKNLNNLLNIKEKPTNYKKLNSLQSTETILYDDIMKIDPKEKSSFPVTKLFISMSPQRPSKMNLILPEPHKFNSTIQHSFNNSLTKRNLMKSKYPSSFEDTAFFGLSIMKQEITMSILGKQPLNYLNSISQNTITNTNNNYPGFQCNNSNNSQLYRNNYTLNTTNNHHLINNTNTGFGYCKKGTASTLWTKNLYKTKGSSTFFNVKSLISKKDTKTTNAFSDFGVKREKTISVLLVDDDENFQRAHKRLLENLSIDDVVSVYDGIDLMMMFLRNELSTFDLIILDNFMTYLNGTEVVKIIKYMKDSEMGGRGGFDFNVLNKIFISTGAQDIAMSSLEQFDTVDFVAKPICKNDMENILRKVLAGVK